jgi:hypothetical protein
MTNEVMQAALSYAASGLGVIAISPSSKIPVSDSELQPNGSKSYTTDPEKIRKLWKLYPKAGVAICTGKIDTAVNVTVVDFDDEEAYEKLKDQIPKTKIVKTPRGYHAYLSYMPEIKQSTKFAGLDKVDTRQEGGYVIAPPTIRGDDKYVWQDSSSPLAEWAGLAEMQNAYKPASEPRTAAAASWSGVDQPSWVSTYLSEGAPEGQRNDVAARICGYLNKKKISADIARSLLESFRLACSPPMEERELDNVVRSIFRYVPAEGDVYIAPDLSAPVVDLSIANRRVFRWPDEDLVVDVSRITDDRSGVNCRIRFRTHTMHLLGPVRLNLLSSSSRQQLVRELKQRKDDINWAMALDQVGQLVTQSIEESGAGIDMRTFTPQAIDMSWAVKPFVQRQSPTLFYGSGGEGKSTIVQAILLSKATGRSFLPGIDPGMPSGVAFLDWEDNENMFWTSCNALLAGMGMTWDDVLEPVVYRRYHGALSDYVDSIQSDIAKNNIELIAIDSLIAASDEDTNDAVAARTWHQVVSSLGVASIGITHVAKAGSDPYGSVYFWNLSRAVWNVSKETEDDSNTVVAITHKKGNNTGLMEPVGLHVEFEADEELRPIKIEYKTADLTDTEDLGKHASVKQHIISILTGTSMSRDDILKELETRNIKINSGRKAITRMQKQGLIIQQANGYLELSGGTPPLGGVST